MLILELTLGQKMQRGSAGSIKGILPRFTGAGWAASFGAFIQAIVYVILLGICAHYLVNSGSTPWLKETVKANSKAGSGCLTKAIPMEEVYFYRDVVKYYDDDCEFIPSYFEPVTTPKKDDKGVVEKDADGKDVTEIVQEVRYLPATFAGGLYGCVCFTWFLIWLAVAFGPKSMGALASMTATIPFVLLIVCLASYMSINDEAKGLGQSYYWGIKKFPQIVESADGTILYENYDPSS